MTSKYLRAALTAAFLLGATSAVYAQSKPRFTPGVQKALVEAQSAAKKQDYPAALAAIAKARAVSNRTPYDDVQITRYAMSMHIQNKDMANATVEAEAVADMDPAAIPDEEKGIVYTAGLQLALTAKHYDKAAKYAKLVQATTPPPSSEVLAMAAQAMATAAGGQLSGGKTTLLLSFADAMKAMKKAGAVAKSYTPVKS